MSEMVEVLVGKLEGAALDWMVAHTLFGTPTRNAHGWLFSDYDIDGRQEVVTYIVPTDKRKQKTRPAWEPSTRWHQGGPLIGERVVLVEKWEGHREPWVAWVASNMPGECGSTLLIAAMRAIVAADSQDAVNVPKELMQC